MFRFDPADLRQRAEPLSREFRTATPFPHVVFDRLVPDRILRDVAAEFPESGWYEFDEPAEVKRTIDDERLMGDVTVELIHALNGQDFMEFLTAVTGIDGLVPDPYLEGAGLHRIERDGLLKVHTDFNRHPRMGLYRRLNLLIYLNDDWLDEYGGHLELWDADMTGCVKRIRPDLGTCVLFATSAASPHGHPEPLRCPPGRSRRSLALYYYHALDDNGSTTPTTRFFARPGHSDELAGSSGVERLARDLLPPVVTRTLGRLRRRLRS